jgi:hypothetical protein
MREHAGSRTRELGNDQALLGALKKAVFRS